MLKNLPSVFARVRGALMRRGRSGHEADDLVQEAWVRLASYEHLDAVVEPEAFLMRTALNLSINAHRDRAAHGSEVEFAEAVLVDPAPGTEDIVLGRERMARMHQCLGRLSEKSRDILLANRVDGLSYSEIGRRYGLSPSTVERYVARATLQITTWMKGW